MLAPVEDEESPEEEKEVELTNEEKVEKLKEALENGLMGPAQFDTEYQQVWMKIKDMDALITEAARNRGRGHGARGSMASSEADHHD